MTITAYSYIRFSSKPQERGDSVRRQVDESRRFAAANGWTLDESLRDLGVSAWRGKNRTTGALAGFLKLVESGAIPKGSILIVEAMDRLSREQVSDALTTFLQIIKSGVGIVTLQDGKKYTLKSINDSPFELMYSIGLMAAANEYSSKLSFRIREARNRGLKRLADGGRDPLHGKPPFWAKMEDGQHKLIPERVKIVKQIIEWAMEGVGLLGIAKRLSEAGIKTKGGKARWDDTTIRAILRSRNLIGEYAPKRMVEGKRVAAAPPVKNYYPAIITEPEWYKLQAILDTRKQLFTGRTGEMTNIFGHTFKMGADGSSLILISSQNNSGTKYHSVASMDSIHGVKKQCGFNYQALEAAFYIFISEVSLTRKPLNEEDNIAELSGRKAEAEKRLNMLQGAMTTGEVGEIATLARAAAAVEGKVKEYADQIQAEKTKAHAPNSSPDDIIALSDQLEQSKDKGELRRKIKLAIAQVVKQGTLWVKPAGIRRAAVMEVEFLNGEKRIFGVRTERSKPPFISYHAGLTVSQMMDSLLAPKWEIVKPKKKPKAA